MKTIFPILVLMLTTLFTSCDKSYPLINNESVEDLSNLSSSMEGAFKEEIIVTDESGGNIAYFAIYSDDETAIKEYLGSTKMKLNTHLIEDKDNNVFDSQKPTDTDTEYELNDTNREFFKEMAPKITIELVTVNLKDNVSSFFLEVTTESPKSYCDNPDFYDINWSHVRYTTSGNFIGTVHRGNGLHFFVQKIYRRNWWNSWSGGSTYYLMNFTQYSTHISGSDYYRLGLVISPHNCQNTINYYIAYNRDKYRSRDCQIGTYDYNNYGECYVGTAPEGTTAFIWAHHFYYTPINGNECPYPNSSFDGANCLVMPIPATCEPYVWQRNWLVKSEPLP